MKALNPRLLETEILNRLVIIPELEAAGFSARAGLTGAGVTVMKGRSFFGSWRVSHGALAWNYAHAGGANYFAHDIDDAVRHTMLLILKSLEAEHSERAQVA